MAAKIKDGLFIGDAETSQSEVFINDNKISNLINLAGKEVPNIWASHGLVYLTYNWEDRPDYRLFSGQDDNILTDIVEFVDVSIAHGISVLLFSKKGTGRCVIAACLYLMMKYRWGFEKSYDYVYSKKPDIDLNKGFIQQMFALDMKLLAARQKAYSLKHGVENGFRIEPNMTINDIASMLPPTEAKRWNSWDPSYILTPNNTNSTDSSSATTSSTSAANEEEIVWHKYSDSVINALKRKDSLHHVKSLTNKQKVTFRVLDDAEEELVLIFSFVNSKNTISSLPGPYHNIYDIQKAFKLRFDQVIFEEDVNMFPNSPINPRHSQSLMPRSILKGSKLNYQQQQQQQSQSTQIDQVSKKLNIVGVSANPNRADEKASNLRGSYDFVSSDSTANGKSRTSTNGGNNYNASDDLYKYVGMSTPAEAKSSDRDSFIPREDKKATSSLPAAASDISGFDDDRKVPMSAEERLRKLMADMQRQNLFPDHLRGEEGRNSVGTGSAQNGNTSSRGNGYPQAKAEQNGNGLAEDSYYSNSASISLYDLANMSVQASTATNAAASNDSSRRSKDNTGVRHSTEVAVEDLEQDDVRPTSLSSSMRTSDPLAAFDIPMQPKPSASVAMKNPGAAPSSSGGVLRARHDILNSSGGYPGLRTSTSGAPGSTAVPGTRTSIGSNPVPGTKQAWGSNNPGSRPASPSSARPQSPNVRPSSNSSVGSVGSDGTIGGRSASSNANVVGSGTTSSAKVYRHGSPAPNTRPAFGRSSTGANPPSPRTSLGGGNPPGASNLSVNSNSMSSLGSGMSNIPPNNGTNLRSSYSSPSNPTRTSTRYSSPLVGNNGTSTNNPNNTSSSSQAAAAAAAAAQRRGSFGSVQSVGSTGSNNAPLSASQAASAAADARRRTMGASPLRASYSGNPTGSSAPTSSGTGSRPSSPNISSKRFSTPTPMSGQHNDNNINLSATGTALGNNRVIRSSTPTKNTWKF